MDPNKATGKMIERRRNDSPWSVEGLAHRASQLEALIEAHAKMIERNTEHVAALNIRMDRSYEMHAAQTEVHAALLKSIDKMTLQGAAISTKMEEMKDMVAAWENVKSTKTVVRLIGDVLKWSVGVVVAGTTLYSIFEGKLPWT